MLLEELSPEMGEDEIIRLIRKDCKRFYDHGVVTLYRGAKGKPRFFKHKTLKNRKPRDTDNDFHDAGNEYFKRRFNIPFRSASIFVTGSHQVASNYGPVYLILPIGKFNYCWSNRVEDYTPWMEEMWENAMDGRFPPNMDHEVEELFDEVDDGDYEDDEDEYDNAPDTYDILRQNKDEVLEALIDTADWRFNTDLTMVGSKRNEVMIACDYAYALKCPSEEYGIQIMKKVNGR